LAGCAGLLSSIQPTLARAFMMMAPHSSREWPKPSRVAPQSRTSALPSSAPRPGLSEWDPTRPDEDGGGVHRVFGPTDCAGRDEPFRSAIRAHLKGHTQALEDLAIEMPARGLSVRDIEDAFKDESGRLLLSRTAVSELGARLWDDYQAFAKRDLSEYEIAYLLVDGIAPSGCELAPMVHRSST
jgi:hypothetical protein